MSPEQAAGRLDLLGTRTDVYCLRATLYCLLMGRAPFAEKDLTRLLERVQCADFEPPRHLDRSIPRALEAVCLQAMALRRQVAAWMRLNQVRFDRDTMTNAPTCRFPENLSSLLRDGLHDCVRSGIF
jgi:hypothetical protein